MADDTKAAHTTCKRCPGIAYESSDDLAHPSYDHDFEPGEPLAAPKNAGAVGDAELRALIADAQTYGGNMRWRKIIPLFESRLARAARIEAAVTTLREFCKQKSVPMTISCEYVERILTEAGE